MVRSREADVTASLRDDATWSSKFGPGLAYGEAGAGVLVASDPPSHTDERLAISRAFRPSLVLKAREGREPEIRPCIGTSMGCVAVRRYRADMVVIAGYHEPNRGLADALVGQSFGVHLAGNVNGTTSIQAAVHSAATVARAL